MKVSVEEIVSNVKLLVSVSLTFFIRGKISVSDSSLNNSGFCVLKWIDEKINSCQFSESKQYIALAASYLGTLY